MSLLYRTHQPRTQDSDNPTTLLKYLNTGHGGNVNWYVVENRLKTHPDEASELDKHGATTLYRALNRRGINYPRFETIQMLLAANPGAIYNSSRKRHFCPMSAACRSRAPHKILQLLMDSCPSRAYNIDHLNILWDSYLTIFHGDAEMLVEYICEGNRDGAQIWFMLHMMLHYCTAQTMDQWKGLHAAASVPSCTSKVLELGFRIFPEQVRLRDRNGRLPMHVFSGASCTNDAQDMVEKLTSLLGWFPEGCMIPDGKGRLPLHIAILSGTPWGMLRRYVYASPDSLCQRDVKTSLYPFQFAGMCDSGSLTDTYELLRAAPHLISNSAEGGHSFPSMDSNLGYVSLELGSKNEAAILEASNCQEPETRMLFSELLKCRHDEYDWKVVHAASKLPKCPLGILMLAIKLSPFELLERNYDGNLPIHDIAAQQKAYHLVDEDKGDTRMKQIRLLLESCPESARHHDRHGNLPLQLAIQSGQSWDSLQLLLRAFPDAIFTAGTSGLLAFQDAAACVHCNLNELYQLILFATHLVLQTT
jgi:hypothetical protein